MSTEPEISDKEQREMRQIIGLLEKSFRIARDASLTGSMAGGREYILQQYNAIVANLAERGTVVGGLFPPVAADASYDVVGVACAQLAEYLKSGLPDEREGERGRRHDRRNVNIIGNVGDLKEIGELIRESLPEWMRAAREKRETRERRESEEEPGRRNVAWAGAPEPIVAPPSNLESELSGLRSSVAPPSAGRGAQGDLERRLADVSARMKEIAEEMREPDLSPGELQRLAGELSRLALEQAEMGREAAS